MIKLAKSFKDEKHLAINERINNLSLVRKIDIVEQIHYPILNHDHKIFKGVIWFSTAIDAIYFRVGSELQ